MLRVIETKDRHQQWLGVADIMRAEAHEEANAALDRAAGRANGVAGAEYVFLYLGSAETLAFDINLSFLVLFMVIIGGLGSVLGSFLGAAFIVLVPIFLTNVPHMLGLALPVALLKQIELMVFGGLIIFFLIVEPHGLARLWQITKEKLRLWPFPH